MDEQFFRWLMDLFAPNHRATDPPPAPPKVAGEPVAGPTEQK